MSKLDKKPCNCESCTAERFYYAQAMEGQIEAKRKAGKQCPPPMPPQNAPSTLLLQ